MRDREAESLRRVITARERGPGKKYSAALRLRAGGWVHEQVAAGVGLREAAERIGINDETASRWLRRWRKEQPRLQTSAVKPVEVADEFGADRRIAVVSPSGFRVDGLTIDEAAALLRALG